MSLLNFRIKLDLSNFYSDVRRFSWIYIDGTKMLQISDLKNHIIELFNIKQPFHLLLNDSIYLPPKENIRILKDNEIILVSCGSELEEGNLSQNAVKFNDQTKRNPLTLNNSSLPSPIQQIQSNNSLNESQNDLSNVSIVDDKETTIFELNVNDNADSTQKNDLLNNIKCSRRKRARRKKNNQHQVEQSVAITIEENIPKKPKIAYTCAIPSGNHIRFDETNIESDQLEIKNEINTYNEHVNKASDKLANLLALGHNSVPLTFTNNRVKQNFNAECVSKAKTQSNISENRNRDMTVNIKQELETDISDEDNEKCSSIKNGIEIYLSDEYLEGCSLITTKPQLNDIVAFKTLKIGSDYTPQESDFIVGQVLFCDQEKSVYKFKILQGLSEIQLPTGKLSIMEGDKEVIRKTSIMNYAQLRDVRLVKRDSLL